MSNKKDPAHNSESGIWYCTCNTCGKVVAIVVSKKPENPKICLSSICNGALRTQTFRTFAEQYPSLLK